MSKNTDTQTAFPEARAKKLSSKQSLWLIGLFGAMVLMLAGGVAGGIMGYLDAKAGREFGQGAAAWGLSIAATVAGFVSLLWGWKYWRSIDEMARRAHLDSWFWGGSIAAVPVSAVAVTLAAFPNLKLDFIEKMASSPSSAFGFGAIAMYGTLSVGYMISWLIWWAKKR